MHLRIRHVFHEPFSSLLTLYVKSFTTERLKLDSIPSTNARTYNEVKILDTYYTVIRMWRFSYTSSRSTTSEASRSEQEIRENSKLEEIRNCRGGKEFCTSYYEVLNRIKPVYYSWTMVTCFILFGYICSFFDYQWNLGTRRRNGLAASKGHWGSGSFWEFEFEFDSELYVNIMTLKLVNWRRRWQ